MNVVLPPIADGGFEVPKGKLVELVTHLEMFAPPARPQTLPVRLEHWHAPDIDHYRALFRRVGEPWLWFSRLELSDAALGALLGDPRVGVFEVLAGGATVGIVEIDRRIAGEAEIVFLGLVPEAVGKGFGRALLDAALDECWHGKGAEGVRRVWLHTCQFDHPRAYRLYCSAGLVPFRQTIEISDDPRANGLLPRDAAPQIPFTG
jgi:GNAT superfamily N-acetyltransferase